MNPEARKLRENEKRLRQESAAALEALRKYEKSCEHRWGQTVYDPIIHPAGYSPGDPPGTMGVDWRGPCSWPETREDRWRRECENCGLAQYTKGVEETVTRNVPNWPGERR